LLKAPQSLGPDSDFSGELFRGLAGCPTQPSRAKLARSDPEETCERLPQAFLFTATEPDPCEPVRNQLRNGADGAALLM
jgi:hypothetical protein